MSGDNQRSDGGGPGGPPPAKPCAHRNSGQASGEREMTGAATATDRADLQTQMRASDGFTATPRARAQ